VAVASGGINNGGNNENVSRNINVYVENGASVKSIIESVISEMAGGICEELGCDDVAAW